MAVCGRLKPANRIPPFFCAYLCAAQWCGGRLRLLLAIKTVRLAEPGGGGRVPGRPCKYAGRLEAERTQRGTARTVRRRRVCGCLEHPEGTHVHRPACCRNARRPGSLHPSKKIANAQKKVPKVLVVQIKAVYLQCERGTEVPPPAGRVPRGGLH